MKKSRLIIFLLGLSFVFLQSCEKDNVDTSTPTPQHSTRVVASFDTGVSDILMGNPVLMEDGDTVNAGETHYYSYTVSSTEPGRLSFVVYLNGDTIDSDYEEMRAGLDQSASSFLFIEEGEYKFVVSFTTYNGSTASDSMTVVCNSANIDKFFGIFVAEDISLTYLLDDMENTVEIPIIINIESDKRSGMPQTTLTIFNNDYSVSESTLADSYLLYHPVDIDVNLGDTLSFSATLTNLRIGYSNNGFSLRGSISQSSMSAATSYSTFSSYFFGAIERSDDK